MNSHKNGVTVASLSTLLTLEGLAAVVNRVTCSVPVPGSNPLCVRLSPPRCLTCSWACRVSSGPWGIVVVRASWPGNPTLIKKKKKKYAAPSFDHSNVNDDNTPSSSFKLILSLLFTTIFATIAIAFTLSLCSSS